MTFATDILDDFTIFDGLETVTLTPQNPDATAVTGVQALRRAQNRQTIAMFGGEVGLSPTDVPFILFVGNVENVSLQGAVPQPGDKITAGSENWTIKAVAKQTLGSRYTCLCKLQVTF